MGERLIRARLVEQVDVQAARDEIEAKSEQDIERETADKWAGRALAAFERYRDTQEMKWAFQAEDYRHETLEHAALVRDGGQTVATLSALIDEAMGTSPVAEADRMIVRATLVEVGTSQGAKKGWQSRKGGAAAPEDVGDRLRQDPDYFKRGPERYAPGTLLPRPGSPRISDRERTFVGRLKRGGGRKRPFQWASSEADDSFEPFAKTEDPAQKTYAPVQASLSEDDDFTEEGTSQGAKKCWQTRKGGGGGGADEPPRPQRRHAKPDMSPRELASRSGQAKLEMRDPIYKNKLGFIDAISKRHGDAVADQAAAILGMPEQGDRARGNWAPKERGRLGDQNSNALRLIQNQAEKQGYVRLASRISAYLGKPRKRGQLSEDEDFPSAWKRFRQAKDRVHYESLGEVTPPGWEGTVKRMKRHPDITNPWALAWWMKGQGYSPRKKSVESQAFALLQAFAREMTRDINRLKRTLEAGTSQGAKKGWMSRKGGGRSRGDQRFIKSQMDQGVSRQKAEKSLRDLDKALKGRGQLPAAFRYSKQAGTPSSLTPLQRKGVKRPGAFSTDPSGHEMPERDLPLRSFRDDVRRKVSLKKLMGPPDDEKRKPVQAEVA